MHKVKFRLQPIPYSRVRQFVFEDLVLADVEGLDPNSPNVEEAIQDVLSNKVKSMIREARANAQEAQANRTGDRHVGGAYELIDPHKVIVRLRVHHAGFPTINQQRFGTQFVGEVANPSDMLLYSKKSKDGSDGPVASGAGSRGYRSEFDGLSLNGDVDSISQIRVEDLVQEALGSQNKQLGLLAAGATHV